MPFPSPRGRRAGAVDDGRRSCPTKSLTARMAAALKPYLRRRAPQPPWRRAEEHVPAELDAGNTKAYILKKKNQEYDSRVMALKVDEKPTEDYNDIGVFLNQLDGFNSDERIKIEKAKNISFQRNEFYKLVDMQIEICPTSTI